MSKRTVPRNKVIDSSSDSQFNVSDSDDGGFLKKAAAKVGNAEKSSVSKPKQLPVPKKKSLKKKRLSESDEDKKPKKKSKPTTTKTTIDSDSVSEFDDPPPPRDKSGIFSVIVGSIFTYCFRKKSSASEVPRF